MKNYYNIQNHNFFSVGTNIDPMKVNLNRLKLTTEKT